MSITLQDLGNDDHDFSINYWNWRPMVEAIRRLSVVPDERAAALHEPFCGHGLSRDEACLVADALERRVLSTLSEDVRLLLDGTTTAEPDDMTFHKVDTFKNYGTSRPVLERFIQFCRACSGFEVL